MANVLARANSIWRGTDIINESVLNSTSSFLHHHSLSIFFTLKFVISTRNGFTLLLFSNVPMPSSCVWAPAWVCMAALSHYITGRCWAVRGACCEIVLSISSANVAMAMHMIATVKFFGKFHSAMVGIPINQRRWGGYGGPIHHPPRTFRAHVCICFTFQWKHRNDHVLCP